MLLREAIVKVCEKLNAPDADQFGGIYTTSTNPAVEGYDGRVKSDLFLNFAQLVRREINRVKEAFKTEYQTELMKSMNSIAHGLIRRQNVLIGANGEVDLTVGTTGITPYEIIDVYRDFTATNFLDREIIKNLFGYYNYPDPEFLPDDSVMLNRIGNVLKFQPSIRNAGTPEEWTIEDKVVTVLYVASFEDLISDSTELLTIFSEDLISEAINLTYSVLITEEEDG